MRVSRWYCRDAQMTFSLLPDCLAARLMGSLDEVERVVVTVETSASLEAAASALRPEIHLPSAIRWVRRRQLAVRLVVVTLMTLLPGRLGKTVRLQAVRQVLLTERALVALREIGEEHLPRLVRPIGFRPQRLVGKDLEGGVQHKTGTDPPASSPY